VKANKGSCWGSQLTKYQRAEHSTSLLAPPPGSSRRCPICSRGNLLPLLFLSLDGRSAPDFGVPLLTESERLGVSLVRDREGKLRRKPPRLVLQLFCLLSGSLSGRRCTAGSGSGSVPSAAWMRCVSGAGAYDEAAASGRGAGPGLSFHLLWLWVGIGGGE
jgi:hypothetical protein